MVIMKKAQAWGFDLVIAIIIFLAGMTIFYFYSINFTSNNEDFQSLSFQGKLVGNNLLSEGVPIDWDESNVLSIGVLTEDKINQTKLERFYSMANSNYLKTKGLFNIRNEYYVFFEENITVGELEVEGIGRKPVNEENLVRMTRAVIYNEKIKNLNIYVWN